MGFIKKLFTKKSVDEISLEEKKKLEELLNEKKTVEDDFDEEYIDDISIPEIKKSNLEDQKFSNVNPISTQKNVQKVEERVVVNELEIKKEKTIEFVQNEEEIVLQKFADNLNYTQISKIREILNKKEKELEEKDYVPKKKENSVKLKEIPVEMPIIKKDPINYRLESERSKINPDEYEMYNTSEYGVDALDKINVTKNASYNPKIVSGTNIEKSFRKKEEVLVIEEDNIEKSELEQNAQLINKLRDIFTDENMFFKESSKINYPILKGDDTTCIGVRKKDAYYNADSIAEQSSWFITQIKKLDDLKNFKVVRSEDGVKDLVWSKEHPVFICFRSINHLPNQDSFSFPENK